MSEIRYEGCVMTDDRRFQEATARCVSIMVAYHAEERLRRPTAEMACDIRTLAREAMGWGVRGAEVERRLLAPVEAELHLRYGAEVGNRLNRAFRDAFEGDAGQSPTGAGHPRTSWARGRPPGGSAVSSDG